MAKVTVMKKEVVTETPTNGNTKTLPEVEIETAKGKEYRKSLPASFWAERAKNIAEIDKVLKQPFLDPEFKQALWDRRMEETRKGYTEEELKLRTGRANTEQLAREAEKYKEANLKMMKK